jgi:ComF family protein
MALGWLHDRLGAGRVAGIARAIGAATSGVADLVLPRVCVACDGPLRPHESGVVCGWCWSRLDALPFPQCARCGHPHITHGCTWCEQLPAYVRAARSVCWVPGGSGGEIVHALKYEGWRAAADGMAQRMARLAWPRDVIDERTAIVPVPLSPARLRERGFNQSELIARALSSRWRIPVWTDALARARDTESQTRLSPGDRLRNVAGAFDVSSATSSRLRGAHVMLVDDVVTTGATMNACAEALVARGARILSYVTFGRARAASDRPLS